jgi:hypothetical protein
MLVITPRRSCRSSPAIWILHSKAMSSERPLRVDGYMAVRLADSPIDPSLKRERLVLYPTLSVRIVGIIGSVLILLLCAAISAAMLLHGGGPWSVLFMVLAVGFVYLLSPAFPARLWADGQDAGVSSSLQRSRSRREELAAIRIEPTMSKYGPACKFVRKEGTVAFKASVGLWGLPQIAAMARFLGLPLINVADTTGNICPVCGFPRLSEPVSVNGVPSHEVCPSCGFAFDDPASLNDQSYRIWREKWIAGGMTWWAQSAGDSPPTDWDPKGQLAALTSTS